MLKRKSNIELLRIVSMFLIVVFHYVYKGGFYFDTNLSVNKFIIKAFWMFGELGVNLFVLITGYFSVTGKFKVKKLILLITEVLFYWLLTVFFATEIGIYKISGLKECFLTFFPIIFNKYWFVTAYVIIYILSPYLNIMANTMVKKTYKKFLAILLFIFSFIPTFFGAFNNDTELLLYYNRLIWLIIIYFVGAYIRLHSISFFNEKKKPVLISIISFLCLLASILIIDIFDSFFNSIGITEVAYLWTPNNIVMFILSLGVFGIFLNLNIPYNKIINKVASTTLGIYLLHDGVLAYWFWRSIFKNSLFQESSILILHIFSAGLLIYVLGFLIDLIRQLIEKYTIIKLLNSNRFDNFIKKISFYIDELIQKGDDNMSKKIKNNVKKNNEKNMSIIKWIIMLLFASSFAVLSFFQLIHYRGIFVIATLVLSFCFSLFFVKNTYAENLNYLKNNRKKSIIICMLSIIILLAMHKSKGMIESEFILSLPFNIFRLRWWILSLPAIFYLLIYLYRKISIFLIDFWDNLNNKEKKFYVYFTLVSSVIVLIMYAISDQWYQQYDLVYSIDSGWVYRNILPNLSYYDIRHPILSIITFPFYSMINFILKILVPSNLINVIGALIFQIINVQLLLIIAFMIKKLTNNKWSFMLYLLSFPVMLFSVFLEKYQLCTFLLVLYVFLCLKNKKDNETNLVLATGVMPTSIAIYAHEIFVKEKLNVKIKKIFRLVISGVSILVCTGRIHLLHPIMLYKELSSMALKFGLKKLSLKECFISFSNMIHGSFISLSSSISDKYLWSNIMEDISIFGIVVFAIVIIGIVKNRKEKFVKICSYWTIVSVALIVIFQWSVHESPLFSVYFSWALIPLFQKGLDFIIKKMKWKENIVYCSILVTMFIINVINIIDITIFFL